MRKLYRYWYGNVSKGKSKVQNTCIIYYVLWIERELIGIHIPLYLYIHKEMLEVYLRTVVASGAGDELRRNKDGRGSLHIMI